MRIVSLPFVIKGEVFLYRFGAKGHRLRTAGKTVFTVGAIRSDKRGYVVPVNVRTAERLIEGNRAAAGDKAKFAITFSRVVHKCPSDASSACFGTYDDGADVRTVF